MKFTKRDFLKIAGLTVVGVGVKPTLDLLAQNEPGVLTPPTPTTGALVGKRWAMVFDAKACTAKDGCKDCIIACHKTHNVPEYPPELKKNEIKWIWEESYEHAFVGQENPYLQEGMKELPFIMMCNHCDNPPCVRVCPTKATFKREDGIVMMDMHRCIGCRFCMAGCPYGSRSFNWADPRKYLKEVNPNYPTRMRGVVEKCTFCAERLAVGLLPACVEACPQKGLTFGDLEDPNSGIRRLLAERFSIRRKAELGTMPEIYYLV